MEKYTLVTEVTRMGWPYICVAGLHFPSQNIIRPLPKNDQNWQMRDYDEGIFRLGNLIEADFDTSINQDELPHSIEDSRQEVKPVKIGEISEKEVFDRIKKYATNNVVDTFQSSPIDNKYYLEKQAKRSLGGIIIDTEQFEFEVHTDNNIRGIFTDNDSSKYDLKINSLRIMADLKRQELSNLNDKNRFLNSTYKHKKKHINIRLGLTRPWTNNGMFNPPRSYIQINELIYS